MWTVERAPAGNGTALPWQARVNGKLIRTKRGVARRFKTKEAAEYAAMVRNLAVAVEEAERDAAERMDNGRNTGGKSYWREPVKG